MIINTHANIYRHNIIWDIFNWRHPEYNAPEIIGKEFNDDDFNSLKLKLYHLWNSLRPRSPDLHSLCWVWHVTSHVQVPQTQKICFYQV